MIWVMICPTICGSFQGCWGRTREYRGCLLGKYRTEVFGKVRYGLNTLPNTPVRFGMNSIPVPGTWVSSAPPPKILRYRCALPNIPLKYCVPGTMCDYYLLYVWYQYLLNDIVTSFFVIRVFAKVRFKKFTSSIIVPKAIFAVHFLNGNNQERVYPVVK